MWKEVLITASIATIEEFVFLSSPPLLKIFIAVFTASAISKFLVKEEPLQGNPNVA